MKRDHSECKFGWGTVGVGGGAVLCAALISSRFFLLYPGAEIRPMIWSAILLTTAAASLTVGLIFTIVSLRREKPVWPALLGMVLCLMPFPVGWLMFKIAAATLNIKMLP